MWTGKIKSLLPSIYKREELPLFGKEGQGRFSEACVFFGICDLKFLWTLSFDIAFSNNILSIGCNG